MGSIKKVGAQPKPGASPVDIVHTIGADYNPTTGKVTGGRRLKRLGPELVVQPSSGATQPAPAEAVNPGRSAQRC